MSAKSDIYIAEIDRRCRNVALSSVLVWMLLVGLSYFVGYRKNCIEQLSGVEQQAPMAAAMLLGASILSNLIPMTYRFKKGEQLTGVVTAGLIVQFVAFITDLMLCTLPVPVFVDPFTGARVFGLRWSEWTPLAFVMTFLTEACRLDDRASYNYANGNMDDTSTSTNTNSSNQNETGMNTSILTHSSNHNILRQPITDTERLHVDESAPLMNKRSSNRDINNDNGNSSINLSSAYYLSLCQGLSTFCGWIFPLINNVYIWIITMIISCLLFVVIYYRLYVRYSLFKKMKVGESMDEKEMYQWARLSLGLLATCAGLWTFLVVAFFVYSVGPILLPKTSFLKTRGFVMVCESSMDVLFKSLYMLLIMDVHSAIFDPNARAKRRLEELRQMMNIVWENSSDVIGLSIQKSNGTVMTLFSPTFLKMYSENGCDGIFLEDDGTWSKHGPDNSHSTGVAFELDAKYFSSVGSTHDSTRTTTTYINPNIDTNAPIIQPSSIYEVEFGNTKFANDGSFIGDVPPTMNKKNASVEEFLPISELVVKAWQSHHETQYLTHDLVLKKNNFKQTITCEANITRLEKNVLVIVLRNVSERFRRFEAEKKAASETTARMKDAAANRFTRHEVKNGLLAAIGLCDSTKEQLIKDKDKSNNPVTGGSYDLANRTLLELDKTLREVLDTVLAEAMARDVIHEVYEAKSERTDVVALVKSTMNSAISSSTKSVERFPVITEPSPFPEMAIDQQLLKYIHRNAMSNACKYGKRGSEVTTMIKWERGMLCMNVINSPGYKHEEILELGNVASDIIFSPSRRLPIHVKNSGGANSASYSSGDGAWVMLKCAKTLGGDCDIKVCLPSFQTFYYHPSCPI